MAFGIWGVGFAAYQQALTGAAYATAVVVGGIASTGLLLGFRGRLRVTSGGVVLVAPFRSRTISWDDIAEVDMVFGRTWVRCRDREGRIKILLATSAWYPRTNRGVRRDNEALATSLWTGSRAG
nr:PH domain-containing protein [Nocardioides albus]